MFVFGGKMELSLRNELQDYKPWETSIISGCEMLMLEIQQWFSVIWRITVLKTALTGPNYEWSLALNYAFTLLHKIHWLIGVSVCVDV